MLPVSNVHLWLDTNPVCLQRQNNKWFVAAAAWIHKDTSSLTFLNIQGVAITGRNTTGPPWSVGRPAPRSPAVLQTTTDASEQNNTGPLGGPVVRVGSRDIFWDWYICLDSSVKAQDTRQAKTFSMRPRHNVQEWDLRRCQAAGIRHITVIWCHIWHGWLCQRYATTCQNSNRLPQWGIPANGWNITVARF